MVTGMHGTSMKQGTEWFPWNHVGSSGNLEMPFVYFFQQHCFDGKTKFADSFLLMADKSGEATFFLS